MYDEQCLKIAQDVFRMISERFLHFGWKRTHWYLFIVVAAVSVAKTL